MARIKVKPSKTQSTFGFIVGLIFIGVGVFVVIPSAGGFGVIWTLMAVIITIINGLNAFTDNGVPTHTINADIDGISTVSSEYDFADKLRELETLYEDGLITHEEYTRKRQEILDKNW